MTEKHSSKRKLADAKKPSGPTLPAKRFNVEPHDFGLKPGVDPDRLNQLADELEAEETARKLTQTIGGGNHRER